MRMHQKMLLGLTAASALSAGVIGGISAQTPGDSPDDEGAHAGPRYAPGQRLDTIAGILGTDAESLKAILVDGGTLAEAATAVGVSSQVLIDALLAEISSRVDAGVESGRVGADRAAERLAQAEACITTVVNEGRPERGDGDRPEYRRQHRGAMRLVVQAANVIGVEPQAVAEALQGSTSIADFAAANGVSEAVLIDGILAEIATRLDQAVANGRIPAEEAATKLSNLATRLSEAVNKVPGSPLPRPPARLSSGVHAGGTASPARVFDPLP